MDLFSTYAAREVAPKQSRSWSFLESRGHNEQSKDKQGAYVALFFLDFLVMKLGRDRKNRSRHPLSISGPGPYPPDPVFAGNLLDRTQ